MTVEREAACSCGQLKIRLSGDPQLVSSCHCQACQRRTGALFGSTSFWRKSQLISVAVGAFADPTFPPPARTVWTETRHEWLAFPATIPHHRKSPE